MAANRMIAVAGSIAYEKTGRKERSWRPQAGMAQERFFL
jgi:hypothetical protein